MGAFSDTQTTCDYELMESGRSRRSKEIVNVEEEQVKVVIFICGSSKYAFYGSDIKEILSSFEISWVPCLPEYLSGLINNRGDIESVVDIRHFLGEPHNSQSGCLIAMAERESFHTGIIIDAIEDVVDIPVSRIHPPIVTLHGVAKDLVCGTIDLGGETISLLDIGKLASLVTV